MSDTDSASKFKAKLQDVWESCRREGVALCLRQILVPDAPLSDIVAALRHFEGINLPWESLRLGDVMASGDAPPDAAAPVAKKPTPQIKKPVTRRVAARSASHTEKLKTLLVDRLLANLAPVTSAHLQEMLARDGEALEPADLHRLLCALVDEGRIAKHPSLPRAWMFRPQGRLHAQTMVIKKASQQGVS